MSHRHKEGGMSEPDPPAGWAVAKGADEALARDWITLWQSELAALAVDREAHETWQQMLALWASLAGALARAPPRGGADGAGAHSAGAAAAPRASSAAAAPDARDAEIDRLAGRVGELERRLADLEGRRG
jgi:hypothetical protein